MSLIPTTPTSHESSTTKVQNNNVKAPRPATGEGSLRVGRLVKPHGLKGGVKLELYTDNPELRFYDGAKFHLQVPKDSDWFGKTLSLVTLKFFNGSPVAFFEELPDRTAVESVIRAILWIDEEEVAKGHENDAWYDAQLVGIEVFVAEKKVGVVHEVLHMPGQDLLSVDTGAEKVLVPFAKAIVPEVDIENRRIVMTPPDGLFPTEIG